jgi:hypothetical protein
MCHLEATEARCREEGDYAAMHATDMSTGFAHALAGVVGDATMRIF